MIAAIVILAFAVAGAFHRLCHGGLLRKLAARAVAGAMSAGLVCLGWYYGAAAEAAIIAGAAWVQWVSPTRDFASSRSLLEAHLSWAAVAATVAWTFLPLASPLLVATGYYAFQRWWPEDGKFWKPTVCAEAWAGFWVWGLSAASIFGIT